MEKNVTKLWEREFNIVKNGLSEDQVVTFVDELLSEQKELLSEQKKLIQRQNNLSSLTKLAERTVTEAQKLAEEIKREAADQANAEVTAIVAEAETRAQQIFEEKRNEIITKATQESESIKANAEREAELTLERQRKRIQPELKAMAKKVYSQLFSELERLKEQIVTMEKEFEPKLFPLDETDKATADRKQPPIEALASIAAEDKPTSPTSYAEKVELEFLPPANLLQILEIDRYLENLPEVEATEIIPIEDKPIITVFLRKPMPLMDMLKSLPEVNHVKEATNGEGSAEDKLRKLQVTLS